MSIENHGVQCKRKNRGIVLTKQVFSFSFATLARARATQLHFKGTLTNKNKKNSTKALTNIGNII